MSEYQYIEFLAVDRPLTDSELKFAEKQSTRAEISRWSFQNEYHYRFNERRVLPRHEKAIVRHAQNVLHMALNAMEHMVLDGAWPPPPERVLPFMRPFCRPRDWSYTQQSRDIDLLLNAN